MALYGSSVSIRRHSGSAPGKSQDLRSCHFTTLVFAALGSGRNPELSGIHFPGGIVCKRNSFNTIGAIAGNTSLGILQFVRVFAPSE